MSMIRTSLDRNRIRVNRTRILQLAFFTIACAWVISSTIGCAAHRVSVRNESDSDLTVRLFVGDRDDPRADPTTGYLPLYHTEKHLAHLKAGRSTSFNLRKNQFYKHEAREPVIRLWVEARAPSFAKDPGKVREHWIELVSFPPVSITVTGEKNDLRFVADKGEVTLVPRELWIDDPDPYRQMRQASAEDNP